MRFFIIPLAWLSINVSFSHPVIYKGGWIYQGTFMPKMNENMLGHTFHPNFAVVTKSQSFENDANYRDYTIGLNSLVKRWLQEDSQGNIYLGAHFGHYKNDQDDGLGGHGFLMADWEDRDHYVMTRSRRYYFDGKQQQDFLIRYGFAPFVGGMDQLQPWLILQAFYYKYQSREVILTPMLRFFYKNVLWEMGSSTKGDTFITLMVHY